MLEASVRWVASLLAIAACSTAGAQQKFPSKGEVTIGSGPLPLLVHYVDGTGKAVQVELRNMQFQPPPLQKSKELAAIARFPCGKGDVVNVNSKLEGVATGADAAGIGRFIWLLKGQYTTSGDRWQFVGKASANDDLYDFNKGKDGERAFWQEVATSLGSKFPGKSFKVKIAGSVDVGISGVCGQNSAGQALV